MWFVHRQLWISGLLLLHALSPLAGQPQDYTAETDELTDLVFDLSAATPIDAVSLLNFSVGRLRQVLNDDQSTPATRTKMLDLWRSVVEQVMKQAVDDMPPEDQEIYERMGTLSEEMGLKAVELAVLARRLFPFPHPAQPPACTVEILPFNGEAFANKPVSAIRLETLMAITYLKAWARDENGNELEGSFAWSLEPEDEEFGHEVVQSQNEASLARTNLNMNRVVEAIKADTEEIYTGYRIALRFEDAEINRTCWDWLDVTVPIREP